MSKDETIDNLWEQSAHGTRREDIVAAYNAGALAEQERHGPVAWGITKDGALVSVRRFAPSKMSVATDVVVIPLYASMELDLDDDHPLSLVNSQIDGLLQGQGASEDHEDVITFFLKTELRADIFRDMINELRDTAKNFHDHDSLRERLRGVVNKFIKVQL